ncbi:MAG: YtxH domain-containing protein [Nitrospirota bacterium]
MFFSGRDNGRSGIIYSALIGGFVGAGLAMLLTPHSGKKMRRRITDMAEDARDYANRMADDAKEYAVRVQKSMGKMSK